ncbi:MAG: 3-phosphoshikimate 1-carboxyvinyltransferase [Candidatus Methanofastidiosa archaeon]|nr:3-phosphoshikimate 1-carboxyvinyltransferase [Candidatus Methanofastidiosa archaeon]
MQIIVREGAASGRIKAPSSKSLTHRAMICSLLSEGTSKIGSPLLCDDTQATCDACVMMGADATIKDDGITIKGNGRPEEPGGPIDCRESASTLRMLLASSALADGNVTFTGKESLINRPIGELIAAMGDLGIESRYLGAAGYPPVMIKGGGIEGGRVSLRGDISSQYISSLLFACPMARKKTTIGITTKLESLPYVTLTLDMQREYGIDIITSERMDRFSIESGQSYRPAKLSIEGDYSSAAFLLVAGCLGMGARISNLNKASSQGDMRILGILGSMGAKLASEVDEVKIERSELSAREIDCSDIPDLVPILAVACTQAKGISRLINISRLRIKESDRLGSISSELKKMGADITIDKDSLIIKGKTRLRGSVLESHNDHRIAMALTVAALSASGDSKISGMECVKKSYPSFLYDMHAMGADIDVV